MNKPLIVRKAVHSEDDSISERQFIIQPQEYETDDLGDAYVCFSGFFGNHCPHVFAAAPELLEALEFIADIDISGADDRVIRFILVAAQDKARAIIAKAKGETK